MKNSGLLTLAKEISKQLRICSAMLLLVLTLRKICNEKDQAEEVKIQNLQIEEKGDTKK